MHVCVRAPLCVTLIMTFVCVSVYMYYVHSLPLHHHYITAPQAYIVRHEVVCFRVLPVQPRNRLKLERIHLQPSTLIDRKLYRQTIKQTNKQTNRTTTLLAHTHRERDRERTNTFTCYTVGLQASLGQRNSRTVTESELASKLAASGGENCTVHGWFGGHGDSSFNAGGHEHHSLP